MIQWTATIKRFKAQQGEKTGWTYIEVPGAAARTLSDSKKGFRVKGRLDHHPFEQLALLPMGGGDFILSLNASLRKAIGKSLGATVEVVMEKDERPFELPPDLIECLQDEPEAFQYFMRLTPGHRNYFGKWIDGAKTEPTRAKRIAASVDAMLKRWDYGQMIRAQKVKKV